MPAIGMIQLERVASMGSAGPPAGVGFARSGRGRRGAVAARDAPGSGRAPRHRTGVGPCGRRECIAAHRRVKPDACDGMHRAGGHARTRGRGPSAGARTPVPILPLL